ncbi:MAG: class I SAM-dependent methyltransferase [Firmicutes bacterium]|nr:class I SAM-dependent methyltransferase [Bacillota bacterium]
MAMTGKETRRVYDAWSNDYDHYISEEEKNKKEALYYAGLFKEHGAKKVLDAACGTGRHAIYLAQQGLDVAGFDISEGMLDIARERAGDNNLDIDFCQASFTELTEKFGPASFDGFVCAGGGVAHMIDDKEFEQGLKAIYDLLKPGGLAVFENRDYDIFKEDKLNFGPLTVAQENGSKVMYLRLLDYEDKSVRYNLLTIREQEDNPTYDVLTFELRLNITSELEEILPRIGFSQVEARRRFKMTGDTDNLGEKDLVFAVK